MLYPLDDVATCVSVAPKIKSFPKIFLGTFENAAPALVVHFMHLMLHCIVFVAVEMVSREPAAGADRHQRVPRFHHRFRGSHLLTLRGGDHVRRVPR